jgi:amidohydrolase
MSTLTAAGSIEGKPLPTSTDGSAQFDQLLANELPALIAMRRDLHMHPELSYQERRTSAIVVKELQALGALIKTELGKGTGVLGYLPASDPAEEVRFVREGGAIGLRADMDALPIDERTGREYSSKTPGVMHACGHDGHTTILLGAARILSKMHRPRPVAFVFQPAEEGGGGAEVMCAEGVLEGAQGRGLGAKVGAMFGLHGWPSVELGKVATRVGPLLAATDDFEVTIRGVQAHGAYPHLGNDSILASAHIISQLQSIVARNVSPLDSCVVTVGAIHAGTADNIIPEACTFIGTIRTLLPKTRTLARERFFQVVEHGARALGCVPQITWKPGYPVTFNDKGATEKFFAIARGAIGTENVEETEHPTMGGEDFSYFGQHVPACFFLLGLRPGGRGADGSLLQCPSLHQPEFDFNDEALPLGIKLMCELALEA